MINKFIRNFIAKQMAGRSDDGIMITLKDPKKVEVLREKLKTILSENRYALDWKQRNSSFFKR